MEIIQKQRLTVDEAINCGMHYLIREAGKDEQLQKTVAMIALALDFDKNSGIEFLVSALCASVSMLSQIVEALCGKTPQEFTEQELKVKFENIDLNEVK